MSLKFCLDFTSFAEVCVRSCRTLAGSLKPVTGAVCIFKIIRTENGTWNAYSAKGPRSKMNVSHSAFSIFVDILAPGRDEGYGQRSRRLLL